MKLAFAWRFYFIIAVLAIGLAAVVSRAAYLQVVNKDYYIKQGLARMERVDIQKVPRGMIVDRNGEPLAISTPVSTIWIDPSKFDYNQLDKVARATGVTLKKLRQDHKKYKRFFYVQRQVNKSMAKKVEALDLDGIYIRNEYKRYYPAGEVAAQVVGLTDIDDRGQEGIEYAFNQHLTGVEGKTRVLKDRKKRIIRDVDALQVAQNGKDLQLTLDLRVQHVVYRELKKAVKQFQASSGSAVLLDAKTGEILAMANQPSYNPNNRTTLNPNQQRNRAMIDVFEPGSVMKPFTIAAALEHNVVNVNSIIDTSPGVFKVKGKAINDHRDYGKANPEKILVKSSNVGTAKIALQLGSEALWQTLSQSGLGRDTGIGFPGEASGELSGYYEWEDVRLSRMSYGYGLSLTPLQLAQSYGIFANQGLFQTARLIKDSTPIESTQVISPTVANQVKDMMNSVVKTGGTGTAAQTDLYEVAGKTATVHKIVNGAYDKSRYVGTFAGIAPLDDPKVILVVTIDDPKTDDYYGGQIAAPAFAAILNQSLPLMNVKPNAMKIASIKRGDNEH